MKKVELTAFDLAGRFLGLTERAGNLENHPLIVWWFELCGLPKQPDEVPWCSVFLNGLCWLLGPDVPRSKSAAARSWLTVAQAVSLDQAIIGWDVVILKRGAGPQPGPDVFDAPGHVGLFAGRLNGDVLVRGGNQQNSVNDTRFPGHRVLGVRRLLPLE